MRRKKRRPFPPESDASESGTRRGIYDLHDFFMYAWVLLLIVMIPAFGLFGDGVSEKWGWAVMLLVGLPVAFGLGAITLELYDRGKKKLPPGKLALAMHGCALLLVGLGGGSMLALAPRNEGLAMVALCIAGLGLVTGLASLIQAIETIRARRMDGSTIAVVLLFALYAAIAAALLGEKLASDHQALDFRGPLADGR